MGVTVFLPHTINKDMMKRLPEYGDQFALTVKDKRLVTIEEKHLEWINFDITNPLPDFLLRELYEKDVYMVAWKIPDTELRPVEQILHNFCDFLSKPQPIKDDTSVPPINMPPILKPHPIMIDDEELERFKEQEIEEDRQIRERIQSLLVHREAAGINDETEAEPAPPEPEPVPEAAPPVVEKSGEDEEEAKSEEEQADEGIVMEDVENVDAAPNKSDNEDDDKEEGQNRPVGSVRFIEEDEGGEGEVETVEEEPDRRTNKVFMLPVWTPYTKTGQAALIYLYFRNVRPAEPFINFNICNNISLSHSKLTTSWRRIQYPTHHTWPLCSTPTNASNSWS